MNHQITDDGMPDVESNGTKPNALDLMEMVDKGIASLCELAECQATRDRDPARLMELSAVRMVVSSSKEDRKMNHLSHTHLTESELTDAVLSGAPIYGPDDYSIGSVSAVHGTGLGAHAVIDVGGFLGVGAKPVAVPVGDLSFMRDEDGNVHGHTSWTKDQLKELPEHDSDDETRDYEDEAVPPFPLNPTIL